MTADIRAILAIISPSQVAESALAWAERLGRDFDAGVVDAAYIRRDWRNAPTLSVYGFYASDELVSRIQEATDKSEADSRAAFEAARQRAPAGLFDRIVSVGEVENEGLPAAARAVDLTVVVQPRDVEGRVLENSIAVAALHGGGPVFAAPPDLAPDASLAHVAIAWDASLEAARAMRASLPFLKRAERVTLITMEERGVPEPVLTDAARYLEAHGVSAESRMASRDARDEGDSLLDEARRVEADMLVMGAYGHSRWLQQLVGGATQHAIYTAHIPLLLSH